MENILFYDLIPLKKSNEKKYQMSVIVVLIGFSILVAAGFLLAFLWAVRSGQYDDDVSPSVRMLFDKHIDNEIDKSDELNANPKNV
jgi:cbb3-type cytochrome oxidase maturation protein